MQCVIIKMEGTGNWFIKFIHLIFFLHSSGDLKLMRLPFTYFCINIYEHYTYNMEDIECLYTYYIVLFLYRHYQYKRAIFIAKKNLFSITFNFNFNLICFTREPYFSSIVTKSDFLFLTWSVDKCCVRNLIVLFH